MTAQSRRPGIRGNLRPDLAGTWLHLTAGDCDDLGPGQEAGLLVRKVEDAGHPECVAVSGVWATPAGVVENRRVLVRAMSLPGPGPAQGTDAGGGRC